MHYRTAVRNLRTLAEACQDAMASFDEPLLVEAHVFGSVPAGDEPVDVVEVALVVDLPSEEVPWESHPRRIDWLVDVLRLDKGRFAYWWRSRHEPVWNHHIREPVRFWSLDGPDDDVLTALAERRFGDVPRIKQEPDDGRAPRDREAALTHLRAVHENYWERDWRREQRRGHRYPENELWDAVAGYLDLLDH